MVRVRTRVVDAERREDTDVALGEHHGARGAHDRRLEGGHLLEERKSDDGLPLAKAHARMGMADRARERAAAAGNASRWARRCGPSGRWALAAKRRPGASRAGRNEADLGHHCLIWVCGGGDSASISNLQFAQAITRHLGHPS